MLEKLKQRLLERIERDAVKSQCTYTPVSFWSGKKGNPITETVYMKRSHLPLVGDWARIYPPVTEDGKWNFVNLVFGGKKNLIKLLIISVIVGSVLAGFNEQFQYIEYLKGLVPPQLLIA